MRVTRALSSVGTRAPSSSGAKRLGAHRYNAAVVTPAPEETERVRRVCDQEASKYDRNVRIPERLLFSGGRDWVCLRMPSGTASL